MVENAGVDVILVAATDYTPTELVAQPEIKSIADLRGKIVLVDAPNTQNALAMKKILSAAGLNPGTDYQMKEAGGTSARIAAMLKQKEYAASMASGQTAAQARQQGLVSLATTGRRARRRGQRDVLANRTQVPSSTNNVTLSAPSTTTESVPWKAVRASCTPG